MPDDEMQWWAVSALSDRKGLQGLMGRAYDWEKTAGINGQTALSPPVFKGPGAGDAKPEKKP
jgi:hypothetical protein